MYPMCTTMTYQNHLRTHSKTSLLCKSRGRLLGRWRGRLRGRFWGQGPVAGPSGKGGPTGLISWWAPRCSQPCQFQKDLYYVNHGAVHWAGCRASCGAGCGAGCRAKWQGGPTGLIFWWAPRCSQPCQFTNPYPWLQVLHGLTK